ncbi:PIF1 [Trichoderma harzianum]|uniref:ATP-dependent DNA helicase n=1 Tax=Trichoderma harzianum TaxID=5544 RepID=A0A0F9ZNR5_TRIHA|nr:PIF1 [Trichoderma harzianum]
MNEFTSIDLTGESPESTPASTPGFEEPPSSIANAIPSSDRPVLCKEQQDLIELILTGRNVFFTGSAGCGKSTVLKAAVNLLYMMGKRVHVVAPTGRAALQVGGMSTWSYMGWTPDYHKLDIETLLHKGFRKHIKKRLKDTHVLIIDEISMVENHHLERMNICMKAVIAWNDWLKERDSGPPGTRRDAFAISKTIPAFGGIQVIVTGDFCQLPPVKPFEFCMHCGQEMIVDDDGAEFNCPDSHGPFLETHKWAFRSTAWEEADFVHVNLQEIHRQKDEYFIRMLQKCRLGIPFLPQETETLMNHPCDVQKATKLLCTRNEVAMVNRENFNRLKTPKLEYHALDGFIARQEVHTQLPQYHDRLSDGTLVACRDQRLEPHVTLRGGMLVILQINLDIKGGLVNGSQGIICGFERFSSVNLPKVHRGKDTEYIPSDQRIIGDHAKLREKQIQQFMEQQQGDPRLAKAWPRVLFHNGVKRVIYPSCVVNSVGDKEPYSLLHRTQIPLLPGWAMSVHRSQGMTLDRVIVDLSHAFEEGQVYVALSRATSLHGLKVMGSSSGLFVTGGNPEVQSFLLAKFGDRLFQSVREFSGHLTNGGDGEKYWAQG